MDRQRRQHHEKGQSKPNHSKAHKLAACERSCVRSRSSGRSRLRSRARMHSRSRVRARVFACARVPTLYSVLECVHLFAPWSYVTLLPCTCSFFRPVRLVSLQLLRQ